MAKVFISHSSKDKDVILLFKDIILKAGIGLSDDEIFFTSSPETGVPAGGNIPEYIKHKINDCDCAFLMISENYKGSEVCLNEMGAAMVLGKILIPVVLYNYDFDKVGWLIDRSLCVRIDHEERLDEIRDLFTEIGQSTKTSVWNRARNKFILEVSQLGRKDDACEIKGLLDYQIEIETNQNVYKESLDELNLVIAGSREKAQNLIEAHNNTLDIQERKKLLDKLAAVFNNWADEMDKLIPLISNSLDVSIKATEGILNLSTVSSEEKNRLIFDVTVFQGQCVENKKVMESSQLVILSLAEMATEQILAKHRVLKGYDLLLVAYQNSIDRINDIVGLVQSVPVHSQMVSNNTLRK